MSPIIQASFWDTFQDVFLYKFMMQVNKGSVHENTWGTQLSIEEHWSALQTSKQELPWTSVTPWKGRDGLWTLSWCLTTTVCRNAAHGFRLPAEVSKGIWRKDVHASVKCLICSHDFSASFWWLVDLQDDLSLATIIMPQQSRQYQEEMHRR